MDGYKETDLYLPVRKFFEDQGYTVRSEVLNCDIIASLDDEIIVAEMKLAFNSKLLYQAVDRLNITPKVYVVIPRPKSGRRNKEWHVRLNLLKRLGLGFMTVALYSPVKTVDVILEPEDYKGNFKNRKKLIKELNGRSGEYNKGGMTGKKILTYYKEQVIKAAVAAEIFGSIAPSNLTDLEINPSVLSRNYDKWFEKVEKGIYSLSEKGKSELKRPEYLEVVSFYRDQIKK